MTREEILKRFPKASASFIARNLTPSEAMPFPFTESEDQQIRDFYKACENNPVDLDALALVIGRSRVSVALRASRLGLGDRTRPPTDTARKNMSKAQKKLALDESVRQHRSEKMKNWIKLHGHNRGFKGCKRSPESLAKMKSASLATWNNPQHRVNSAEYRQRLSDNMSKMRAAQPASSAFSRAKYGRREDLGDIFFRSAWEANYARYLNFLVRHEGKIERWEYEPETFWFEKIQRGCRSYKPDFKVWFRSGIVEYHEVKGWMYPRARTALNRMKKYHPQITIVLIDQVRYNAIARQVGKSIKGWE